MPLEIILCCPKQTYYERNRAKIIARVGIWKKANRLKVNARTPKKQPIIGVCLYCQITFLTFNRFKFFCDVEVHQRKYVRGAKAESYQKYLERQRRYQKTTKAKVVRKRTKIKHKEKIKTYNAKRYLGNRDRLLALTKKSNHKRYWENPERFRQKALAWAKANPEKVRARANAWSKRTQYQKRTYRKNMNYPVAFRRTEFGAAFIAAKRAVLDTRSLLQTTK